MATTPPAPPPPPLPTLADAISQVETNQAALATADTNKQTTTDKLNAAQQAATVAAQQDTDATTAYNASLDNLIAVATAAKRV